MSVSASSPVEPIRDETDQSAGRRASEQEARLAVGAEVLQALNEIDRIALQGSGARDTGAVGGGTVSRVLCATDGTTSRLNALLLAPTPVVRAAAGNTVLIGGAAARNAASLGLVAIGGVSAKR